MQAMQNFDKAKELAAQRSLEFVEDGMVVGLGSGTTATHFIKLLGERVKQGLKVRGIASSKASEDLATSLSIPVIDFHVSAEIDVAIERTRSHISLNSSKAAAGHFFAKKLWPVLRSDSSSWRMQASLWTGWGNFRCRSK
jgi:hypothetical protein